jgi:hypothetical protein
VGSGLEISLFQPVFTSLGREKVIFQDLTPQRPHEKGACFIAEVLIFPGIGKICPIFAQAIFGLNENSARGFGLFARDIGGG